MREIFLIKNPRSFIVILFREQQHILLRISEYPTRENCVLMLHSHQSEIKSLKTFSSITFALMCFFLHLTLIMIAFGGDDDEE